MCLWEFETSHCTWHSVKVTPVWSVNLIWSVMVWQGPSGRVSRGVKIQKHGTLWCCSMTPWGVDSSCLFVCASARACVSVSVHMCMQSQRYSTLHNVWDKDPLFIFHCPLYEWHFYTFWFHHAEIIAVFIYSPSPISGHHTFWDTAILYT